MVTSLSERHHHLADSYKVVVVGSGYGGSITAARLAAAGHEVCLLERGQEWIPGSFPDSASDMAKQLRGRKKPLGLYEFLNFKHINVFQGSGLGGGSLINANVAIRPDPELFDHYTWPQEIKDLAQTNQIWNYFTRVEGVLQPGPHPGVPDGAGGLRPAAKVEAMRKHAATLGPDAVFHESLPLAVNYSSNPVNQFGVPQAPCIHCGDCFSGCNVRAKKTLYMNYLPLAKQNGARIFTQIEVRFVKKRGDGRWDVHCVRHFTNKDSEEGSLIAENVVFAAGALGSTGLLQRSRREGLAVSDKLGERFSGNGDFFGVSYNGDDQTDIMGFGDHEYHKRSDVKAGPSIIAGIQYARDQGVTKRFIVEDASLPRAAVNLARVGLKVVGPLGANVGNGDNGEKLKRLTRDSRWNSRGALNHSMVYLVMGVERELGTITLNPNKDVVEVTWPGVSNQAVFTRMNDALREHARTLKGNFVRNFNWLLEGEVTTVHPLGGCAMAEDETLGVVDARGRVFDGAGGVHQGLYVADGSILRGAVGVNPFLTISAFAERIAEQAALVI